MIRFILDMIKNWATTTTAVTMYYTLLLLSIRKQICNLNIFRCEVGYGVLPERLE